MCISLVVALTTAQPSYYDSGVSACRKPHDHYSFCDTKLSIDERVKDIIKRIPDSSKANLLTARGRGMHKDREALPDIGVPSYYWGSNCIHSSMFANCTKTGRCSTSFPSGPNQAASFDRDSLRALAMVVGKETRAGFNMGNFTDNGLNGMGLDCWGTGCAALPAFGAVHFVYPRNPVFKINRTHEKSNRDL